jgi:hypothetical protein
MFRELLERYAMQEAAKVPAQPSYEDIAQLAATKWWPMAGMAYGFHGAGYPAAAATLTGASIPPYALRATQGAR